MRHVCYANRGMYAVPCCAVLWSGWTIMIRKSAAKTQTATGARSKTLELVTENKRRPDAVTTRKPETPPGGPLQVPVKLETSAWACSLGATTARCGFWNGIGYATPWYRIATHVPVPGVPEPCL